MQGGRSGEAGVPERILRAQLVDDLRDVGVADRANRTRSFLPRGLQRFQRRAEEVMPLMREAFLRGVATRQVRRVVAVLTGEPVSAQTVSNLTRRLDRLVKAFQQAPLKDEWAYLFLDGVSLRVRRPSGRQSVQMLVAYGVIVTSDPWCVPPGKRREPTFVELNVHPEGKEKQMAAHLNASGYQLFATFLLCAARHCDAGKCDRCGKLFWNRWGHLNKRFCGRKCTQLKTASEGQSRNLARKRREKNKRIRQALAKLVVEKPAVADWKAWVVRRARLKLRKPSARPR